MANLNPEQGGKILIVDDELVVRDFLGKWFTSEGYTVKTTGSAHEALTSFQPAWDVALLYIKMPGVDGIELQQRLRQADPDLPVIIMTGYASVETAVKALKNGAYDYITKPFDPDELVHLVRNAIKHRHAQQQVVQLREHLQEVSPHPEIIGNSAAMKRVCEAIEMVAPTDSTVLITGESGTGKELVARAIHRNSRRADRPFVAINSAAITPTLLESELFGHERGAFTGAVALKKGKLEAADGGTVFLDEIGELSLELQAKLLRVLEDHQFERVGGIRSVRVDFRLIAATNRNLELAIADSAFRRDLYYRLKVVSLAMPPLKERREDIPLLAEVLLKKHATSMNRPLPRISPEAVELLLQYDWPGNVRELENAIERVGDRAQRRNSASGFPLLPPGGPPSFRAPPGGCSPAAYRARARRNSMELHSRRSDPRHWTMLAAGNVLKGMTPSSTIRSRSTCSGLASAGQCRRSKCSFKLLHGSLIGDRVPLRRRRPWRSTSLQFHPGDISPRPFCNACNR